MTTYTKLLYRISEVSAMLNLPTTTIKYWTDTFDEIQPQAIGTGRQVKYRPEDIETIKVIQMLMHDRKMQIEGAKKHLANSRAPYRAPKCHNAEEALKLISKVAACIADNPKASAILSSVERWIASQVQNESTNED